MEIREKIAQYACSCKGDWNLIAEALRKESVPSGQPIHEKYITIVDEQYPPQLKKLRYPPWVLFYQGDLRLLQKPMITIVGSRQLSEYGQRNTAAAADILKERFVIVSGLAKGADAKAHTCAMKHGHTIAVIGCGIPQCYPACNRELYQKIAETDLILSEYPYDARPERHHFPWRNRILAALGEACIVSEATMHSGTMLTVNEAISLSKDVWCFPYPFGDISGAGCNLLISQGAGILYEEDQLREMMPKKTVR
jgi:DNA processing protein